MSKDQIKKKSKCFFCGEYCNCVCLCVFVTCVRKGEREKGREKRAGHKRRQGEKLSQNKKFYFIFAIKCCGKVSNTTTVSSNNADNTSMKF